MPDLLGLGEELESILFGVLGYLMVGVLIFFTCFVISKIFLWHRRFTLMRKRKKMHGLEGAEALAADLGRRKSTRRSTIMALPRIMVVDTDGASSSGHHHRPSAISGSSVSNSHKSSIASTVGSRKSNEPSPKEPRRLSRAGGIRKTSNNTHKLSFASGTEDRGSKRLSTISAISTGSSRGRGSAASTSASMQSFDRIDGVEAMAMDNLAFKK